ncbi:hypothetical protein ACQ7DA_07885 [Zafaria sp. J156]|uniref:hypothetical protein n=1 Tax=Zafaria sp. J156 TaxID=3116490 RepID=UPI002E7A7F8A|nr:hypothetical protein [Zafaria sp. J156]MEE1620708.1 hypothetical protein [Zafaria sp. J156]
MKFLIFIDEPGPADGMVVGSLIREGHTVHAFNTGGWWMAGGSPAPTWLQNPRLGASHLATAYFTRFMEAEGIDLVLSSGASAGAFAATHIERTFLPLVWRRELDFSASSGPRAAALNRLLAAADRLLLEDEWEMDKACIKGSRAAHLLMPYPVLPDVPVLDRGAERARVALIHPDDMDAERLEVVTSALGRIVGNQGAETTSLGMSALYGRRSLEGRRDLQRTLKSRLAGATHVVLVGSSPHTGAVLAALRHDWDRVFAENTISMEYVGRATGFAQRARGTALLGLVNDSLAAFGQDAGDAVNGQRPDAATDEQAAVPAGQGFGERLLHAAGRQVVPGYEELAGLQDDGPVNVYFAAAPLQDRSNGARPQRIRNMAAAMEAEGPTVRLLSDPGQFRRRVGALRAAFAAGRPAGLFYGENSTSPIPHDEVMRELGGFLPEFRAAGGRSLWFVRDLHWLDDELGMDGAGAGEAGNLRERGLRELGHVGGQADLLAAPSTASMRGFLGLLQGHPHPDVPWIPLPPAVARENVVDAAAIAPSGPGVTLLYAGGIGTLYSMPGYLSALALLPREGYVFDFLVRRDEAPALAAALGHAGLTDDPRVRVLHGDLEFYLPETERCLGVVLLESSYASFSFPYKTMSMIERGFPILTYRDSAIAPFVEENGIGTACGREAEEIAEAVVGLSERQDVDFDAVRGAHSWRARLAEAARALRPGDA